MLDLPANSDVLRWFIQTDLQLTPDLDENAAAEVNKSAQVDLSGDHDVLFNSVAGRAADVLTAIQFLDDVFETPSMTRARRYLAFIDLSDALTLIKQPLVDKLAHQLLSLMDAGKLPQAYTDIYSDFLEKRNALKTVEPTEPLTTTLDLV